MNSIFRVEPLLRYRRKHQTSVLLRFSTSRANASFLFLLVLLASTAVVACLVPVPLYIAGRADLMESPDAARQEIEVEISLPAGSRPYLRLGQRFDLTLDRGHTLSGRITELVPQGLSVAEESRSPSVVCRGLLSRPSAPVHHSSSGGGYPVWIGIGPRPTISLLPGMGRRFGVT